MTSIEELRLDAVEVQKLADLATRQRAKDCLMVELRRIETLITQQIEQTATPQSSETIAKPVKTTVAHTKPFLAIKTYGWDQSSKFMKIYVTLQGIQDVPKDQITCTFGERSFNLRCEGVKNKNYECVVTTLLEEIVPAESRHKVKTDSVLIMLKKKTESTWAYVTETEKKKKDKSKMKDDMSDMKDPNESIMKMMQNMYEEGDDDMKRTIAKAWSESNEKKMKGEMF